MIAQSLVNEGIENVIYVCSTIDLVYQTAAEADRLGIQYTIRAKKNFSNDLFETGKAFCITTYAALFNGHSAIRHKFFPEAVIFDDAHVAESMLRDAFTLRIESGEYPDLFKEIAELFKPHFKDLGVLSRFRDSLSPGEYATAFAAPRGVHQRAAQLLEIFNRHKVSDDQSLTYAFAHLEDNLSVCAAVFSRGVFELSPPFLPSLALDIFERPIGRIYLSATLQSQTDFVRAFGRLPAETITPSNDAGNGERLIVFGRNVKGGFSAEFAKEISHEHKLVIAVPGYFATEKWKAIASPTSADQFSNILNNFRQANTGAFILVSRVDGIDLPHDTCRLMLMDGLPGGTSLLERYQWEFLRMNNVHAVRVANRLAQLFGRINRGRNDYGVFFIEGHDLNVWLSKDRNVALLPPLLQKQVMLGREVQSGMSLDNNAAVIKAMQAVLGRDKGWLDYYEREVKLGELDGDQLERAKLAEPVMVEATIAEAKYAAAMWNGNYAKARKALDETIDNTAAADTPLGGWHSVWLGAAFDLEKDIASVNRAYAIARSRIGSAITLPRDQFQGTISQDTIHNSFAASLQSYLGYSHGGKFENEIAKLKAELDWITSGTPKQAEAGVRKLGELLGFSASRPDNDQGTGPDVIWIEEESKLVVGFELKTDKNSPASYFKKEIAQGHDHLSWIKENYNDYNSFGLLYVGPDGYADSQSNPSKTMGLCVLENMASVRERLIALIEDLRQLTPLERPKAILKASEQEK